MFPIFKNSHILYLRRMKATNRFSNRPRSAWCWEGRLSQAAARERSQGLSFSQQVRGGMAHDNTDLRSIQPAFTELVWLDFEPGATRDSKIHTIVFKMTDLKKKRKRKKADSK